MKVNLKKENYLAKENCLIDLKTLKEVKEYLCDAINCYISKSKITEDLVLEVEGESKIKFLLQVI